MARTVNTQAIFNFLIVIVLVGLVTMLTAQILQQRSYNPFGLLVLLFSFSLILLATMRPFTGLIAFLWVSAFIDFFKRFAYVFSNMHFLDVAVLLVIPVLLMCGIYFRVLVLNWFKRGREFSVLELKKFWPVVALTAVTLGGLFLSTGLNFGTIRTNYAFIAFIPAAIAVPLLLDRPERWKIFCKHCFWILIITGTYGISQAVFGPLQFERDYMMSGLTIVTMQIGESGEEIIRAFSTFNSGPTFTGVAVMCAIFSAFYFAKPGSKSLYSRPFVFAFIFAAVCCFAATQRGALVAGFMTLCFIGLFSERKKLILFSILAIGGYVSLIVFIDPIWSWIQWFDRILEPYKTNDFLRTNLSFLTFGERVDSFRALKSVDNLTLFGRGLGRHAGHDLLSNLLGWVGIVGTLLFLGLALGILYLSAKVMDFYKAHDEIFLWARVNLSIFAFILVWSLGSGSVIHISPMNFFFWASVGNLIALFKNEALLQFLSGKAVLAGKLNFLPIPEGVKLPNAAPASTSTAQHSSALPKMQF